MKEDVMALPPAVQLVLEMSPYAMCASDVRVRYSPPTQRHPPRFTHNGADDESAHRTS